MPEARLETPCSQGGFPKQNVRSSHGSQIPDRGLLDCCSGVWLMTVRSSPPPELPVADGRLAASGQR